MNKIFLKHKGKVSEEQFFEYLNSICENESIKTMILEFYELLKTTDNKLGKMLTIKSFGKTPENFPSFPLYTDQAKYLFLSEEEQSKDDELIQEFILAQERNKTLDESLRKDANQKAFEVYQSKQEKLFDKETEPIGVSDLFRFQFVNFVDTISIDKACSHNVGSRGFYYGLGKELRLFNITEEIFVNKNSKQYFKLQNTINHELTHMFTMKSVNFGKNYLFTSPYVMAFEERTGAIVGDDIISMLRKNRFVLDAFMSAEELINELATDYYSLYLPGRLVAFYNPEDLCYVNSPKRVYGALSQDKDYEDFTSYTQFGHLFEIIFRSKSNLGSCICNNQMSVWGQYSTVAMFLESAKISPELKLQVDTRLAEIFGIESNMFQNISQFDKFKLLIGTCFYNNSLNNGLPFDEDMMLAQTIILDIIRQRFEDRLKSSKCNLTLPEFDEEYLKGYLKNQIAKATAIDKWVIKPNMKINKSKDQFLWANDVYSNAKLAELAPQNPAVKVWARYLGILGVNAQKFIPEMVENTPLIKKEIDYLKEKNINTEK